MGLALRMILYVLLNMIGGAAFLEWTPDPGGGLGSLTINLDGLAVFVGTTGATIVTFLVGRWRKARGGSV